MTGYEDLRVTVTDSVAEVVIDRAAKRNALTLAMWQGLGAACRELSADTALRAVVVSGAGPSFCAGADISALSADDTAMKSAVYQAEEALRSIPVPTVAKIRGHCVGGGNQIAVACDLRIADATASFAVPPARLGVVYPVNSVAALVSLVGPSAAKRRLFTAERIDAAEALRLGLVDRVVEPDALDAAVRDWLASLLPLAPLTQRSGKQIVNAVAAGATAAELEQLQRSWQLQWAASDDGREGPAAFLERRAPRFTWRPGR